MRFSRWLSFVLLVVCLPLRTSGEEIDFNRDVRPILSDKCYRCHGPDEGERQTDLRLDDETSAYSLLDSETRAVEPGNPSASEIIRRIRSTDADIHMPPIESGKQVSSDQLQILERWIQDGAKWGSHWSFTKPTRPALPSVEDSAWPKNEIDYFVLARLEDKGWQPAKLADRRTRIRRAHFAATGLPPAPEEVSVFVADRSPDAYRRLVDRLLHSPRYGEHQTRYWLDLARYGDTHGLHLDNERSIWRYRDWVIDAFNNNMPFDRFTIEQLAGDLLPDATLEHRIATGFHRCNVTTSEGGAIAEEFLARYAVDRAETTSAVWLGLTTGCAACHDHKFDPISQKEFYQLYAYFYNLTEKAMDGNAKLPPPAVVAPTLTQRLASQRLHDIIDRAEERVGHLRSALRADRSWEQAFGQSFSEETPAPSDSVLHVPFDEANSVAGGKLIGQFESIPGRKEKAFAFDGASHVEIDGFGDFEQTDAFSLGAWTQIKNDGANTILSRMNDDADYQGYDLYVSGGKVFVHLIHKWQDNVIRVNTTLPIRKEKWHHVFATYDGSSKAAGITIYVDGVAQDLERTHDSLSDSIRVKEPFRIGKRKKAAGFQGAMDDLYVFDRVLTEEQVQALAEGNPVVGILEVAVEDRTPKQDAKLIDAYLRTTPNAVSLDKLFGLKKQLSRLEQAFPSTLVMEERTEPREAFVLVRGEYDNKGDSVVPGVPAIFPKSKSESQSRLALAQWLVDKDHPLTARVTVNRIWQQYFGVGLVQTSEDFGSQGEWPSHPKLLDYLATELLASDWDLKALHRKILLSATFQQSSNLSAAAVAEDPENRLLSHGPRFRLDAEMIRDFAMSCSGLLVEEIGGPSVKPYQPMGLWKAVGYTSSNTANFKADTQEKLYRRGMYTFWKRTSPPPQMQVLDAPSREVCTIRRPRTNTPGAALLLLNDVQFVEAARNLAARVLRENDDDGDRLDALYGICLSRIPENDERVILLKLLLDNRRSFQADDSLAAELLSHGDSSTDGHDENELAAWTVLSSTVLNLDEAINQH